MGQFIDIPLLLHVSYNPELSGPLQLRQQVGRNGDTYLTKYTFLPSQKVSSMHGFWGRIFCVKKSIFHYKSLKLIFKSVPKMSLALQAFVSGFIM